MNESIKDVWFTNDAELIRKEIEKWPEGLRKHYARFPVMKELIAEVEKDGSRNE